MSSLTVIALSALFVVSGLPPSASAPSPTAPPPADPASTAAGDGKGGKLGCSGAAAEGAIGAECGSESGSSDTGSSGRGINRPSVPCSWEQMTAAEYFPTTEGSFEGAFEAGDFVLIDDTWIGREHNGVTQAGWLVTCEGSGPEFRWVDTTVTVTDLRASAYSEASSRLPIPALDMNPPPSNGGIVNLGLWLAIVPPEPVTARAEAGGLWAEVTASVESTSWDLGNGDVVHCDGTGTPIEDLDIVEQGPCGYTYRSRSADDEPYVLSVTATWSVTYRSSGGSGTLQALTTTASTTYDVDEIQTIGVQG